MFTKHFLYDNVHPLVRPWASGDTAHHSLNLKCTARSDKKWVPVGFRPIKTDAFKSVKDAPAHHALKPKGCTL